MWTCAGLAHWRALKQARGVDVIYTSGSQSLSLVMVPARSDYEVETPGAVVHTERVADWIVLAADLDFGSGPHTPLRGDVIRYALRGYVVSATPDERHYDWMDTEFRLLLRIHTMECELPQFATPLLLENGEELLLENGFALDVGG